MSVRALLFAAVVMVGIACSAPPCQPITTTLNSVCHRADAGAIAPSSAFVLEGSSGAGACTVSVDGGAISLEVTRPAGCGVNGGADLREPPAPLKCTIPPLQAGTYTVNSQPAISFTIPGDAGVPPCF